MNHDTIRTRLELAADDIGRLRRGVPPGSSLCHTVDRLSDHVEALSMMVNPSAGEIAAMTRPGCDATVVEAIRVVDARLRSLRVRLGYGEAA